MAKWSGRETIAEFFSSIFLLLRRTVPIPRWCSGKEKRIGRRKVGKEKNRRREGERKLWPGFDSERQAAHGGPTPRGKREHSQRKWTDGLEAARLHLEQNRNPVVYIPARSFSARVRARHESADGKSSLSGWFTTASIRPSIPLVRQMQFRTWKSCIDLKNCAIILSINRLVVRPNSTTLFTAVRCSSINLNTRPIFRSFAIVWKNCFVVDAIPLLWSEEIFFTNQ